MRNVTPSDQMSLTTLLAVGELVQAAAHQNGVTGPVEFTVLGRSGSHWCGGDDDDIEMDEYNCPFCGEWNRCECFDDDDLDDRLTDDLYDQL